MKKLILAAVVILSFGLTSASAQEIKLGVHGGVPVGDAGDYSDFLLGASVSYLWSPTGVFQVGPKIGYEQFFVKDEFGDTDVSFLPIAAEGRVSLGDVIFAGLDLGYGVGLNDGNDGGFYYSPKIGFGFMSVKVIGSYSSFSRDGGSASSVNAGVEFSF